MKKVKYSEEWFQGKYLYGMIPLDMSTLALLSDEWYIFNAEDLATAEFPQQWLNYTGDHHSLVYYVSLCKEAKRTGKSVLDITYPNEF